MTKDKIDSSKCHIDDVLDDGEEVYIPNERLLDSIEQFRRGECEYHGLVKVNN